MGGTVTINVTISAPHNGILNPTTIVNGVGTFSERASYFAGSIATSVNVRGVTIALYPPLETVGSLHPTVQGGQVLSKPIQSPLARLRISRGRFAL